MIDSTCKDFGCLELTKSERQIILSKRKYAARKELEAKTGCPLFDDEIANLSHPFRNAYRHRENGKIYWLHGRANRPGPKTYFRFSRSPVAEHEVEELNLSYVEWGYQMRIL